MSKHTPSRREALQTLGLVGAAALVPTAGTLYADGTSPDAPAETASPTVSARSGFLAELKKRVDTTPMVDSHEHLPDEVNRLQNPQIWTSLFQHYLGDDFNSAGLDGSTVFGDAAKGGDSLELWRRLEPFWPAVKNTGYGQSVRIAIRELYGIDRIEASVIPLLQKRFEEFAVPGFYERVLREHANIESCQVDSLGLFRETTQPGLLLQDINFCALQNYGSVKEVGRISSRIGITVNCLEDWHETIRRVFQRFGPYATAVKNQTAYSRGLDFEQVPAEKAEGPFKKKLEKEPLTPEEEKLFQDHLFWFCIEQADQYQLPVKLHTGYYAGSGNMPLSRLSQNPAQACELCRKSPRTRWVFMHTCYPYSREMIAVAKQFPAAHLQTCWAWIIDPIGTKNFLKQYLVTAPANKLHVFGGDYLNVECVLGHARIARNGVFAALAELTDEGYLANDDALELVEPLLRGNAHRIFQLEKKYAAAKTVPW